MPLLLQVLQGSAGRNSHHIFFIYLTYANLFVLDAYKIMLLRYIQFSTQCFPILIGHLCKWNLFFFSINRTTNNYINVFLYYNTSVEVVFTSTLTGDFVRLEFLKDDTALTIWPQVLFLAKLIKLPIKFCLLKCLFVKIWYRIPLLFKEHASQSCF